MKKKKVLQFIHGLNMGGAETLVKEYCLGLDKEKYEVSLLCFYRYHTPYEKLVEEAGIRITYIDDFETYSKSRMNKVLLRVWLFIKRIFFVRRYVRKESPDIIHTHLNDNTYVWTAHPPKGTRIFHTVHSELKELWDGSLEGNIDFYASRQLIKKYQMRFITLHEEMKEETNKFFGVNDSVVLNNGIDFTKFDAALPKDIVRQREGIPADAFVIGHVGRFNELKNHVFLVKVFHEIYKKNKRAYLLLVGNGDTMPKVQQQMKQLGLDACSKILSYRTDIPDLLNAMDRFVLPSTYEGLGIVLIEAQKMKLPCVASDVVPDAATISNLVKKLDLKLPPEIWAKEIEEFSVEDIQYHGLEDWDMKNVINKLETIYEDRREER